MNAFEKRISVEDVKNGVVVYPVFCISGSVATVCDPVVFDSAVYTDEKGKLRVAWRGESSYHSTFVTDLNIKCQDPQKQHSFHALFLNKEDAEEYASMFNNDLLPDDLRATRDELVKKRQQKRDLMNDWW